MTVAIDTGNAMTPTPTIKPRLEEAPLPNPQAASHGLTMNLDASIPSPSTVFASLPSVMRLSAFVSPPPVSSHAAISSSIASPTSIANSAQQQPPLCSPPPCLLFYAFLSSSYRLSLAVLDVEIRKIDKAINAVDAEIQKVEQIITHTENKAEDFNTQMIAILTRKKSPEMSASSQLEYSGLAVDKTACYSDKAALQQEKDQLRLDKDRLRQEKLELLRRAPSAAAPVAPSSALFDSLSISHPFCS